MQETQFTSWVRNIPWRRDRLPIPVFMGFPGHSDGKESTCNAGNTCSIPDVGRSAGEGIGYHTSVFLGFPCGSAGKEPTCSAGYLGLIPGLGRSAGKGDNNPLQYSCLENPWTEKPGGILKSEHRIWVKVQTYNWNLHEIHREPEHLTRTVGSLGFMKHLVKQL